MVESLADAPISPAQRRVAILIGVLVSASVVTSWLLVGRPLPWMQGPAFFTAYDILSAGLDATTAFLLFAQFRQIGTVPMLFVASGYAFNACMALLHVSTIDGLMFTHRLFGEDNTTFWLRIFWLSAVPMSGILCALTQGMPRVGRPDRLVLVAGCGVAVAVLAASVLASPPLVHRLPDLSPKPANFTNTYLIVLPAVLGIQAVAIGLLMVKTRGRSVLSGWLILAIVSVTAETLSGWVLQGVVADRRYSAVYYIARCAGLAGSSVLLLALLNEIAAMYRRIAASQHVLERVVAERTADLAKMVGERDLLLREVYHRVKNNLQTMDALVFAEQRRIKDPAAKDAFVRLRNRVFALGLVHKQLMASDDLATFSIQPFLEDLVHNLAIGAGLDQAGTRIVTQVDPVVVTLDVATPVGLLVTELLSNAIKHGSGDTIHVGFGRIAGDAAELVVANGCRGDVTPSPESWEPNVGSRVINGLVRQLRGKKVVRLEGGIRVEVSIPIGTAV